MEKAAINLQPVVLVVEDDPFVRLVNADMLEDAGFRVLQAGNADAALRVLRQRSDITVVVTDVEMPGSLDGLTLAWIIHERWPGIGIVVASGSRPLGPGALPHNGYFIQKPFMGSTLIHRVQDLIGRAMESRGLPQALSA